MTEIRARALTIALLTAAGLAGFLYASRDAHTPLGRVGTVLFLLSTVTLLGWASATWLSPRPRVLTWARAVASAGVLVAVAVARVPLALSGLVSVAAALSLADTLGMFRIPKLTLRAGARASQALSGLLELGYRLGFVLLFALVTTYKVAPDRVTGAIRALFPSTTTVGPRTPIRFRTLDASVAPADVPTSTRLLRPLMTGVMQSDVPAPLDVTEPPPVETPEGIQRWLAQTEAAAALQRKMTTLRAQSPGTRFTRTISRRNECGFVATLPDGRTQGWAYDATTRTVVQSRIPWAM